MDTSDNRSSHSHEELVTISGTIHKIVFRNEENNYTVARFLEEGHSEPITVVGYLPSAVEGQYAILTGTWEYNQRFGPQVKIKTFKESQPTTHEGIERFLGSGLIEGIGQEMAKRIVDRFGEKTFDIIDNTPGRLKEVEGIGKKRITMILNGWKKHRQTRHIMVALNEFGLTPAMAMRVFNKYREEAVAVIEQNPYRLAYELHGVGFKTADEIAQSSGQPLDSPHRIEAAILYFLRSQCEEGDVYMPYEKLAEKVAKELSLPVQTVTDILDAMIARETIILEKDEEEKPVYLKELYLYETAVASMIAEMTQDTPDKPLAVSDTVLNDLASQLRIEIDDDLRKTLPGLLNHRLMIITGGPGTGKTTLVQLILRILQKNRQSFQLAAPTGRAAKRMHETTGYEAMTLHRLLEYVPRLDTFQRNSSFPLDASTIIVDEVSMVDIFLMYHLLSAVKPGARLILVGDADQLPSVGPGAIIQNLITLDKLPLLRLTRIYRQAHDSLIVDNAHRINQGKKLVLQEDAEDFFFIEKDEPEAIIDIMERLVAERIPGKFGMRGKEDIQVLSPMRKGVLGVENLNIVLQNLLNNAKESLTFGNTTFKLGDKVMQTRNNYDLDVFNGDIGYIIGIDEEYGQATIDFYGRHIVYERAWLEELCLAYAISVHKSQGSEYPAVVMPVTTQHFIMLQRNLLYTAVTRAKKLVVLIGSYKALDRCLYNNQIRKRNSLLAERCARRLTK